MSSRFFRSGGDDSSSDDDSSVEEEISIGEDDRVDEQPQQIRYDLPKGGPVDRNGRQASLALSQPSLNSAHRDVLLHALLEEHCFSKVLREHEWSRRGSADIRKEAQARYERLCSRLVPLNLVSKGMEHESNADTRQAYRDGLNMLSEREHPSIRQQSISKAVTKLLAESVSSTALENSPEEAGPVALFNQPRTSTVSSSQYVRDFEELGVLGKGGYGTVFHVRHRLDSHAYAVKKVRISSSALAQAESAQKQHEVEEVLLELRTLAQLEHPNVVRYYSSWVELNTPSATNRRNSHRDGAEFTENFSDSVSLHRVITATTDSDHDSGSFITFAEPSGQISVMDKSPSPSHRRQKDDDVSSKDDAADVGLAIAFEPTDGYRFSPSAVSESGFTTSGFGTLQPSLEPCLALHIQMALYPMTLAEFLTPGRTPNVSKSPKSDVPPLTHCFHLDPSIRIMLSLLDGVEYIHSRGIIHRDLKPANIFLRIEDHGETSSTTTPPKQGAIDLGLCEPCRAHKTPTSPSPDGSSSFGPRICICIGDFGLVSKITTPTSPLPSALASVISPPMSPTSTSATTRPAESTVPPPQHRVGTELYRPLESPSPNGHVSSSGPATDLFALGIIAFELLYPFSTQMERRTTLMNLRRGEFPEGFPEAARDLIGEMLGFSVKRDVSSTEQSGNRKSEEGCTVEGLKEKLAGILMKE